MLHSTFSFPSFRSGAVYFCRLVTLAASRTDVFHLHGCRVRSPLRRRKKPPAYAWFLFSTLTLLLHFLGRRALNALWYGACRRFSAFCRAALFRRFWCLRNHPGACVRVGLFRWRVYVASGAYVLRPETHFRIQFSKNVPAFP